MQVFYAPTPRGPTRGSYLDANDVRVVDNLLKPDLVAPGNRIVAAAATRADPQYPVWNYVADVHHAALVDPLGIDQVYGETQMMMSGTSIASPAVAGAVALLLQSNPGLTPPLVKAILQYTAQPLPDFNLLQPGAGLMNVEGAVRLARTLRTDIASRIAANGMMMIHDPHGMVMGDSKDMRQTADVLDQVKGSLVDKILRERSLTEG